MLNNLKKWKLLNYICIIAETAVILILFWRELGIGEGNLIEQMSRVSWVTVLLLLSLLIFPLTQLVLSFLIKDMEREFYDIKAKLSAQERRLAEKEITSAGQSLAKDGKI